jgi:hypothetical protein
MANIKSRRANNMVVRYSDVYIEQAFFIWYKNGRPTIPRLMELIPPDELDRRPAQQVLDNWPSKYRWHERADIMDLTVEHQITTQAIEEKVAMLNRHAAAGQTLVDKALQYVKTHEITKMSDAIRMLVMGVEIEQASRGLPQALIKISEMNDETLGQMVNKLLAKMNPEEAVKLIDSGEEEVTVEGDFADADNGA